MPLSTGLQTLPSEPICTILEYFTSSHDLYAASCTCKSVRKAANIVAVKMLTQLTEMIASATSEEFWRKNSQACRLLAIAVFSGTSLLIHFDIPDESAAKFHQLVRSLPTEETTISYATRGAIAEAQTFFESRNLRTNAEEDNASFSNADRLRHALLAYGLCFPHRYKMNDTHHGLKRLCLDLASKIENEDIMSTLKTLEQFVPIINAYKSDGLRFEMESSWLPDFYEGNTRIEKLFWEVLEKINPPEGSAEAALAWKCAVRMILSVDYLCTKEVMNSAIESLSRLSTRVPVTGVKALARAGLEYLATHRCRSVDASELDFPSIDEAPQQINEEDDVFDIDGEGPTVTRDAWDALLLSFVPVLPADFWETYLRKGYADTPVGKVPSYHFSRIAAKAIDQDLMSPDFVLFAVKTCEKYMTKAYLKGDSLSDSIWRKKHIQLGLPIFEAAARWSMKPRGCPEIEFSVKVAVRATWKIILHKYKSWDELGVTGLTEYVEAISSLLPSEEVCSEWTCLEGLGNAPWGLLKHMKPYQEGQPFSQTLDKFCHRTAILNESQFGWLIDALKSPALSPTERTSIFGKAITEVLKEGPSRPLSFFENVAKNCPPAEVALFLRLILQTGNFFDNDATTATKIACSLIERLETEERNEHILPFLDLCISLMKKGKVVSLDKSMWKMLLPMARKDQILAISEHLTKHLLDENLSCRVDFRSFPTDYFSSGDVDAIWKAIGPSNSPEDDEDGYPYHMEELVTHLEMVPLSSNPSLVEMGLVRYWESMNSSDSDFHNGSLHQLRRIADVDLLTRLWTSLLECADCKDDEELPSCVRQLGILSPRSVQAWRNVWESYRTTVDDEVPMSDH
ncbi:hypothetical protein DFJ73DRAFT_847187 [Zopfochytrium polystomum]|nr:hypothetical protein DFJ73DRAFT_847187 [Zopfochytrium polystomum]